MSDCTNIPEPFSIEKTDLEYRLLRDGVPYPSSVAFAWPVKAQAQVFADAFNAAYARGWYDQHVSETKRLLAKATGST